MIHMVRGDTRSFIRLTFRDESGAPLNLTGNVISVLVTFRSQETNEVVFTVNAEKVEDGEFGQVLVRFPGESEGAVTGKLSGEVEIDFDGDVQTIYERISVFMRERFT